MTEARVDVDPEAPAGTIVAVEVDDLALALIRHADGWVAADRDCPHARCSLVRDGEVVAGTTLICNCHGSEFDLRTGEVLLDPADQPLRLRRVRPSGDGRSLLIDL